MKIDCQKEHSNSMDYDFRLKNKLGLVLVSLWLTSINEFNWLHAEEALI